MPAAFVVTYGVWTQGRWRDSRYGVHLMVFSAAFALILLYLVLSIAGLVPDSWRPYAGIVIYFTAGSLFLWRLTMLVHDHRQVQRTTQGKDRHATE
jgi:hypothetical protein